MGKKVILNTLGRIARSYELYAEGEYFYYPHGICFRGLHRKKNFKMEKKVLRWNEYSFCPYMGPNSRENNGPNSQPAPCMIPIECSGISTFTTFTLRGLYILFPTFHLRRSRSTINVHSTTTFHNPPFLLLSLILNTANTVLRFQQQAIHMRNNDSVICFSYRL